MTQFIQMHLLTAYPPANLNRDDTGRPKTAIMGGVPRLRVSSQSLKRAWRTSEVFEQALDGNLAKRTKRLGGRILDHLVDDKGAEAERGREIAREVAACFGKVKSEKEDAGQRAEIETLAFISPDEQAAAFALADRLLDGQDVDLTKEKPLIKGHRAVDVAMFGRMLADDPAYNCDAAVQVAHAVSTHRVVVEDDYFTAVDDLKDLSDQGAGADEERGASHLGFVEFGSGLFYIYICIDRDLLAKNLGGDEALARNGLAALVEAAATVSPKGKQATFASRARAHYLLAERGPQQPRTLAAAFLKPISNADHIGASIAALEDLRARMDGAYGPCAEAHETMDVAAGEGTLARIVDFVAGS